MLKAVNKLAVEPKVKEAVETGTAKGMVVEVPMQSAPVADAPTPKAPSAPAASATITSSTDAKEIADMIQAEIKSKEQPKPTTLESNLKSEVADLISKSLAQHTIKEKTGNSLI